MSSDASTDRQSADGTVSEEDLAHCANEPIERPGSIQPFGALLVVDAGSQRVVQLSLNAPVALGGRWVGAEPASLLGQTVWDLLGFAETAWRRWCAEATAAQRPTALTSPQTDMTQRSYEWLLHQPERRPGQAPVWALEWVPAAAQDMAGPADLDIFWVMAQDIKLLQSSVSTETFERRSVELISELTGYDRVMLYRFAPDWSGQIVAEATRDGSAPRFLGLHFPASDIPAQARRLYLQKNLRLIGDAQAPSVPLIGAPGFEPDSLDMGQCLLRSTSPMHLQYLHNMGVRATLTISLLHEGRLWGMLACHHHSPKVPPHQVRQSVLIACELMATSLAGRLETLQQVQRIERERSTEALFSELGRSMLGASSVGEVWDQFADQVARVLGGTHVALRIEGQWIRSSPISGALLDDLQSRAEAHTAANGGTAPLLSDSVAGDFGWPIEACNSANLAGLSATVLPGVPDSLLLVSRAEWAHSVDWAGQPGRFDPVRSADGRILLGPRQSFETWREVKKHHCRPWESWEAQTLQRLAGVLARAHFQRETQRAQAQWQLLHSSMEHLRDMVIVTDANPRHSPGPRIVYANPVALEHSGYTADELLGQTPRIFQGPRTDPEVVRQIATAIHHWQPIRVTLVNYKKNGESYWVELDIAPIRTHGDWYTHWVSVQRDVTQERQISMQLAQTHDRLSRVLKGANDAAWDYDLINQALYCSPRWFEMLGYQPDAFKPTPELTMEMVKPDERGPLQSFLEQIDRPGNDQFDGEFSMRHKGGHYVPVHCRGWIERDGNGRAIHVSGANTDITTRRRADREQEQEKQRLENILRGTRAGTWQLNLLDYSSVFNEYWAEMLGYSLQELQPKGNEIWVSLLHPEDKAAAEAAAEAHISGRSDHYTAEFRMRHKDGHWVWIQSRGQVVERDAQGRAIWMFGTHLDVSEARASKLALELEKQRLENTLKGTGAGTWQYNPQTQAVVFDERWAGIMGRTLESLGPLTYQTWVTHVHPDDVAKAQSAMQRHLDGLDDHYSTEFRMPHIKGHWVWIQARGQVIERDAQGQPVWILGTHVDITEARNAQQDLEAQHRFLYEVTSQLPGVVYEMQRRPGESFQYNYLSEAAFPVLGVDPESVMRDAQVLMGHIHPEDAQFRNEHLERSAVTLGLYEYRFRYLKPMPDGTEAQRWLESHATPKRLADGTVVWHGFIRDVTDRLEMQQALETAQADLSATLTALPDLLFEFDSQGRFLQVHAPNTDSLLLPAEDYPGRTVADIAPQPVARLFDQAMEIAAREGQAHGFEYHLDIRGQTRWFELSVARKIHPGDEAVHFVALMRDITERKSAERRVEELAFYDPLTGLSNRRFLLDRIDQALLHNHVSGDWLAVIFIDLDHFKNLNDTLGHHVGDQLLQQVAMRLEAELQMGDTVARIGGDEFAILLPQLGGESEAAALQVNAVAQKLLKALNLSYVLSGSSFHCTPSLGIATGGPELHGHSEILKRADIALYQAKNAGRNCARFFDEATQAMVAQRSSLEQDLRTAVEQGQLRLYFQPIVNARGQTMGHEALVRWQHPERGMVPPVQFIPLAEQSHLILEIGQWVLDTACQTLAEWAGLPERAEWTLSVNVSARQIETADFVETVQKTLQRHAAPAQRLKLELTESLLQDNVQDSIQKMNALTALGVKFSLDDFGTGYSSLSYLKRLPLNQLKIDRAFVRDMLTDPDDAAIARMIIQLAQTLRLTVVAEGVETEGQFGYLAGMGCDAFQGYLFGKPVPHDQISSSSR